VKVLPEQTAKRNGLIAWLIIGQKSAAWKGKLFFLLRVGSIK
jgi:hypothetical protein